jgi:hypothetical protein
MRMKAEGRLKGDAVVATVWSSIGLELALKQAGIDMVLLVATVVMEEMLDGTCHSVASSQGVFLGLSVHGLSR